MSGSTRLTVPSPWLATQTAPAPAATASGSAPTWICCTTTSVAASTRVTRFISESATHRSPAATASPAAPTPTCTV